MVAPLRGTETLREAQGGKEEVGEGKMRKEGGREDRKKNLQRKEQYKKYLQILHKNLCKH